ncbi:MAG: hypothetical protein PF501_08730 [Salinisphaera sp.]|jgi:hypothetical protein|nr:hypothetical protein [Salinisphaera sp.]
MRIERKTIRSAGICVGLLVAALLSGCAGVLGPGNSDYSDLPGSGDHMAKGPGVFHAGQDQNYEGGYRVFSTNPSKKALVNSSTQRQTGSEAMATNSTVPQDKPVGSLTPSKKAQFRQFQEYQQFKHFQQMPHNTADYQKFRDWQEWKQYEQWKNSGSSPQQQ